jgi:hypothetical protein
MTHPRMIVSRRRFDWIRPSKVFMPGRVSNDVHVKEEQEFRSRGKVNDN